MAQTFLEIDDVAIELKKKLSGGFQKKKIALMYAFNGIGKTRISKKISDSLAVEENESGKLKVLSYNAFFEDLFTWNNEEFILNFNPKNYIVRFIIDQGLENQITDNFQKLTRSRILPSYDLMSGQISFTFASGDDRSEDNVKISRGEESLFVWCVFYTVVEAALLALNENGENRETELFNELEYIIIDDPVSSVDDTKIISMAIELVNMINGATNKNLKFLITTHHALFFNIIFNEYNKRKENFDRFFYLLSKTPTEYKMDEQGEAPFAYHIAVIEDIQKAITESSLQKYHFNLFRGVLEKTANFLGYKNWSNCLEGENRKEIMRLVNLYSHGKLSDLESRDFPDQEKDIFKESFNKFLQDFKWGISTPSH